MRLWESLFVGSVALLIATLILPQLRTSLCRLALSVAAAVFVSLHLWFEGYRWQLVPAYSAAVLVAGLLFVGWIRGRNRPKTDAHRRNSWWQRLCVFGSAVVAVAVIIALPILVPHLEIPSPTGPLPIGTLNLNFVVEDRPEPFTSDRQDCRELFARVWYPAELPDEGEVVAYAENAHGVSEALTGPTPLPSFCFDHLALTPCHAYRNAQARQGQDRFPVVIFSHAYWGSVSQCTVLMEDLASHGYVAVSLGHPYETPYAIGADGSICGFDPHNEQFRLRGELTFRRSGPKYRGNFWRLGCC